MATLSLSPRLFGLSITTDLSWKPYIKRIAKLAFAGGKHNEEKERIALKELKEMKDTVIKKADKGNTLIVMDSTYYKDKLVNQDHLSSLNTYEKKIFDSDKRVFKNLSKMIAKHKCLTQNEIDCITNFEWKSSTFYVIPKIHKCNEIIKKVQESSSPFIEMKPPKDLKARPIIAGIDSPTSHLSQFLHIILSPIVKKQKTYIKDDWDFLRKIPRNIDSDSVILTCDIVNLYTSIPHNLGLKALQYWIEQQKDLIADRFTSDFLLESASFILENNNFIFDDQVYHQITGTAMGTDFAPNYACLTIRFLEETLLFPKILPKYFSKEEVKNIEQFYFRYVDDGTQYNKNGNIYNVINFLDVSVILKNNKHIKTDIFYKETNTHDYLNYNSFHPFHIKKNIPYNLAKRIIVFTSDYATEKLRLTELKLWLKECLYPDNIIEKAFHNVKLQGPAPLKKSKEVFPLVTTFYSNLNCQPILTETNLLLSLSTNARVKEVFSNIHPVIAYKQPPNLLRQLTSSKFHSISSIKKTGLFKCKDIRCKICQLYLQEVDKFETSNGTIWNIKSRITCNSKNVIYYLKCLSCNGLSTYTGKTNNFIFPVAEQEILQTNLTIMYLNARDCTTKL
ncbi:uncharacterized protein LOC136085297 [Hydra vulgaris]|uniref:Uncharacterized protein LOC136085297 n=1 Tax=Hydra vulgaris TaxID=6087 RepID=A0ABM4CLJ8_HYDVU